ncbi:hypothetical protein M422DRAFT_48958 [Sphaerobolus stellatus SS14]|uniref:Uncharacterized protein n=1 Tax=Sphaerobolus stellatus (strain SS14) TaxID=990650 RepID=A0A0C9VHS0_SPHS4|nr:hypothetical protein M422DRAFT_48958 [Sphaerobolus stellatus SS14]
MGKVAHHVGWRSQAFRNGDWDIKKVIQEDYSVKGYGKGGLVLLFNLSKYSSVRPRVARSDAAATFRQSLRFLKAQEVISAAYLLPYPSDTLGFLDMICNLSKIEILAELERIHGRKTSELNSSVRIRSDLPTNVNTELWIIVTKVFDRRYTRRKS